MLRQCEKAEYPELKMVGREQSFQVSVSLVCNIIDKNKQWNLFGLDLLY